MENSAGKNNIDMTNGSLFKGILALSIPLVFSQLLQVMFNLADIAVVGRFSSAEALGSVGSTATLVTLFVSFLIGMGSGVNVKVAYFLGAKSDKDVVETVHTSLILCGIVGIILFIVCFSLATPLLELLKTKDELIEGAVLYFRLYSIGFPALAVFNFGNAVLSAKGDTKRPLFYLTTSGVINVLLNLVFVIGLGMSVDGVAIASIISEYVSATLVLIRLFKLKDNCKLSVKNLKISKDKAKIVLGLGIPAGFQGAIFAIANLFIQSAVNSFPAVVVEGNSAAANADSIVYNVMAGFYTATATYIGQNFGAKKRKRALNSMYIGMFYSALIGAVLGGLLLIFGKDFLSLFTTEEEVVTAGFEKIKIMAVSYWISAFMDCTISASRGIGKSLVPTIIVIMGSCVFRIIWIYTIFAHYHTITSLYLLYMFSWTITSIAEIIYFVIAYKKLVKNEELKSGENNE